MPVTLALDDHLAALAAAQHARHGLSLTFIWSVGYVFLFFLRKCSRSDALAIDDEDVAQEIHVRAKVLFALRQRIQVSVHGLGQFGH